MTGGGATMDHMELEKSAASRSPAPPRRSEWGEATINLIDTPGHVDFTVEVERSLRVLDGAILVLCAVGGVQAQSLTIDRQMRRYHVPRLAFINKMDRVGADPQKVVEQLRAKLDCDAVLMQLPIGREARFPRASSIWSPRRPIISRAKTAKTSAWRPIPAEMAGEAAAARQHLLESLSMYSDELMETAAGRGRGRRPSWSTDVMRVGGGPIGVHAGVPGLGLSQQGRAAAAGRRGPPAAFAAGLPDEGLRQGRARATGYEMQLVPDPDKPTVAMAFKMVEDPYGTLTFMRIYQGRFVKGGTYFNQRTGRKERFSRILRMHADQREDIEEAEAGDIVAVLGVDCASGDTYASERNYCTLENMFVPEPVIRMAIAPANRDGADRLSKALHRFRREDPTLQVTTDEETGETIIAGMGELHLDIYVERIRREYNVAVEVGAPEGQLSRGAHAGRPSSTPATASRPAARASTPTSSAGSTCCRRMPRRPSSSRSTSSGDEFRSSSFRRSKRAFARCWPRARSPAIRWSGLAVYLEDGSYHEVDSSDHGVSDLRPDGACARRFPRRGRCCWNR